MSDDERLEEYLTLCARVYQRMLKDGSFPWRDSTGSDDVIESDDLENTL